jgi:hypothetical protein
MRSLELEGAQWYVIMELGCWSGLMELSGRSGGQE